MEPVAVTIISPAYAKIGKEAVERVREYTGLKVEVIRCKDSEGYQTKLELDKRIGRKPVLFFDADWWALREFDARGMLASGAFYGVQDPTVWHEHCFPHKDCLDNGLLYDRYINTGFWIADFRNPQHRRVMQTARETWRGVKAGIVKTADHTDQFCINKGLIVNGVAPQILPRAYNFFLFAATEGCCEIPREIIGLHAAGIMNRKDIERKRKEGATDLPELDKHQELVIQSQVFGRRVLPMKAAALRMAYAVTHEMR